MAHHTAPTSAHLALDVHLEECPLCDPGGPAPSCRRGQRLFKSVAAELTDPAAATPVAAATYWLALPLPRYRHRCPGCLYLGHHREFDLYLCFDTHKAFLARFADRVDALKTTAAQRLRNTLDFDLALVAAYLVALAAGLLPSTSSTRLSDIFE
jgi:hypothetical protein